MTTRIGVVLFPGSNRDIDAVNALEVVGAEPVILWHEDASLDGVDAVLLPGGFAYGDYLRAGVIARFSPVVASPRRASTSVGSACSVSRQSSRLRPTA